MSDIYLGEDLTGDMKDEINKGIRYALVIEVNDDLQQSPQDEEAERVRYLTVTLQFVDYPSAQKQISLTGFEKESGDLKIPEVGSLVMCLMLPSRRALMIAFASGGDVTGQQKFRTLRDFVKNGTLLPLQRGEKAQWVDNKVYSYIRRCTKKVTQTLGTLLDATLAAVQFDSKDVHYQVEHETGTKVLIDADGQLYFMAASGQKVYLNLLASAAVDDDALLTRAFLTKADLWAYANHQHSTSSPGAPTGGVIVPIPAMPDGVSTPDVRAKRS